MKEEPVKALNKKGFLGSRISRVRKPIAQSKTEKKEKENSTTSKKGRNHPRKGGSSGKPEEENTPTTKKESAVLCADGKEKKAPILSACIKGDHSRKVKKGDLCLFHFRGRGRKKPSSNWKARTGKTPSTRRRKPCSKRKGQ